jgi:hypothetical protein
MTLHGIDRCPICGRHAPWSPLDALAGFRRWAIACPAHRPVLYLPAAPTVGPADTT